MVALLVSLRVIIDSRINIIKFNKLCRKV